MRSTGQVSAMIRLSPCTSRRGQGLVTACASSQPSNSLPESKRQPLATAASLLPVATTVSLPPFHLVCRQWLLVGTTSTESCLNTTVRHNSVFLPQIAQPSGFGSWRGVVGCAGRNCTTRLKRTMPQWCAGFILVPRNCGALYPSASCRAETRAASERLLPLDRNHSAPCALVPPLAGVHARTRGQGSAPAVR